MYQVFSDGICIYDYYSSYEAYQLINPKLSLSKNAAGSLTMTLPPGNIGYNIVKRLSSEITVLQDNKEIWSGRPISEEKDFWNQRVIVCEGELAYLNDIILCSDHGGEYPEGLFIDHMLEFLLDTLYSGSTGVDERRKIYFGGETVSRDYVGISPPGRKFDFETVLSCIQKGLVDVFGGVLQIKKGEDGRRELYYLSENDFYTGTVQTVEFGKNLLDFVKSWDMTDFATVIIPKGANDLTIKDVNNGSIYLEWEDGINTYGRIEKVVEWPNVKKPEDLFRLGNIYLDFGQFEKIDIEISFVDLRLLNPDFKPVTLMDNIRCISVPHGMDCTFPVTKIDIPLDKPENTIYTLGDPLNQPLTTMAARGQRAIGMKRRR